jgi:coproporphyrinogen III oxidase-like Fe-S oxidoreductase
LLCNLEIKDHAFTQVLGCRAQGIFPILDEFVSENLLRRKKNGWEVTGLGRPFVRAIAKTFDAYQNEIPKRDRPFSKVS